MASSSWDFHASSGSRRAERGGCWKEGGFISGIFCEVIVEHSFDVVYEFDFIQECAPVVGERGKGDKER